MPDLVHCVVIRYTNWRGIIENRQIDPTRFFYGSTEWHPEEQWLLEAYDHGKKAFRTFAVKDIHWLDFRSKRFYSPMELIDDARRDSKSL